ncbi:MAG TPA: glycosyltransferase family 39 protein [Candidatus Didemnitutus sp.]
MNEIVPNVLRLAILIAGLIVPGTMILRAARLPRSLAGAFLGSCFVLHGLVVLFACLHFPISVVTLGLGLFGTSAVLALVSLRPNRTEAAPASPPDFLSSMGWALIPYALLWLVVAYRLATDPLNGPDVQFRWARLADEILRTRSLDFYPPVSAADFIRYFWPESIPPGIGSLYAWAFGCGTSTNPHWTTPVVVLELAALHELVWRIARTHSPRAGIVALLLLSASPLLNWTFLLGQETGLLAVGVVGLAFALEQARAETGPRWLVLAGISAAVAASTREYGPAFAIAALAIAGASKSTRSRTWIVAAFSLPVAAWLTRTWIRTGNPLYSLDVAGIFPTNPIFVAWNNSFRAAPHASFASLAGWQELARYIVIWALPSVLGIAALFVPAARRAAGTWPRMTLAALSVAIWAWSVGYTAGGLFYSLRVLAPALALLVIPAADAAVAFASSPVRWRWVGAIAGLVALEAIPKSLVLPDNSYRVPPADWPAAARRISAAFRGDEGETVAVLQSLTARYVVADGFGLTTPADQAGIAVAPIWSPDAQWLFDSKATAADARRRLAASGLRYVVIGRTGTMQDWVARHVAWDRLGLELKEAGRTPGQIIFELRPNPAFDPAKK